MNQAYKKLLEMESAATLKLEHDRLALKKIRDILYQDKRMIVEKLIIYLKRELNIDYAFYKVVDIDDNIADILVKRESKIFEDNIRGKDYLSFNVEELIDNRMFNNNDEIIIIDLNFDEELLNIGYICDSLNYKYLSYSDELKSKLSTFVNYVIDININK